MQLLELPYWLVRDPKSSQYTPSPPEGGNRSEMRCRIICFFFIILNVEVVRPLEKPNDCVKFHWNHTFEFSFFSKENNSAFKRCVRNLINNCVQNHPAIGTKSCKKPVISVNFPLISGDPNITFSKLHRPVLATKEAANNTASQILRAFEQIWQLFVLCLIAAMLSGILIWFFDHKANSGQFPNSFWSGIREGLWWAIVTMTTVGYGDKTPRTFLGRAYASLWMIIGMLLMSAFTAQITSSITADELSPLNEIFGSKIGVPKGSKNFFLKYSYGAESVTEYSTERELLTSLQNDTVDKVWLFGCQAKEINPDLDFMIVSVLGDELFTRPKIGVGVQLKRSNFSHSLSKCLKKMDKWKSGSQSALQTGEMSSEMKTGDVDVDGDDDDDGDDGDDDDDGDDCGDGDDGEDYDDDGYGGSYSPFWETDTRCLKEHSKGKYRQGVKRASSDNRLGLIDYVLLACGALIIILLIIGSLWNIGVRVRSVENIAGRSVDVEMGVWNSELGVKTRELQTEELAAVSG